MNAATGGTGMLFSQQAYNKREDGIFKRDLQEKSFFIKSHHLIQYPCKWSCTAFALNKSSSSSFKTEDINFL